MTLENNLDGTYKKPETKGAFKHVKKSLAIFGIGVLTAAGVMHIASDVGNAAEKHLKKANNIAAVIGDPNDQIVKSEHPKEVAEYLKQENDALNDQSQQEALGELALGVIFITDIPLIITMYRMRREFNNAIEPQPEVPVSV